MSPKEKAKELLKEFAYWVDCTSDWGEYDIEKEFKNSKQCAIFTVDEVLIALQKADTAYDLMPSIDYWNEVKKEIESL